MRGRRSGGGSDKDLVTTHYCVLVLEETGRLNSKLDKAHIMAHELRIRLEKQSNASHASNRGDECMVIQCLKVFRH